MANNQQGKKDEARKLLDEASLPIHNIIANSPESILFTVEWWVDWVNAKILLREAQELIQE
jgi:hypothetical protein